MAMKSNFASINLKPLIPVLSIGLFALLWLVIFGAIAKSGILWSLSGDTIKESRAHVLHNRLFQYPPGDQIDVLLVGDPLFMDHIDQVHPVLKEVAYALEIPSFNYYDLVAVKATLRGVKVNRIVVQSSPHLWSDYWYRLPTLETNLWRAHTSSFQLSLNNAKLAFDTLKKWAKAKPKAKATKDRPESLFATHPTTDPRKVKDVHKTVRNILRKNGTIAWVVDKRFTPDDTPTSVLEFFNSKMDKNSIDRVKSGDIILDIEHVTIDKFQEGQ